MFVAPNITCFLLVNNRIAVLLNAEHIPYVVFLNFCLMPGVGLALHLSCALLMVLLLPFIISAFAPCVHPLPLWCILQGSDPLVVLGASFVNVSWQCLNLFIFLSCFSILLSETEDSAMEYFLLGTGGAFWTTGIAGGVIIMFVVLLGTWVSTDAIILLMFVCNVGGIVLLHLFLTTVIHPSSSCSSLFPCPPHLQLSFVPSHFLCFGHWSSLPVLNSFASMYFNFIFLQTLPSWSTCKYPMWCAMGGVFDYFLQHLHVTGTTVSSLLDVRCCWPHCFLHCLTFVVFFFFCLFLIFLSTQCCWSTTLMQSSCELSKSPYDRKLAVDKSAWLDMLQSPMPIAPSNVA